MQIGLRIDRALNAYHRDEINEMLNRFGWGLIDQQYQPVKQKTFRSLPADRSFKFRENRISHPAHLIPLSKRIWLRR